MTRNQLIEAFEAGDLGEVEFFELAMDAGIPLEEINATLTKARVDLET